MPHIYGINIGDGFRHLVYHMENWMRYDATIVGWLVGPVLLCSVLEGAIEGAVLPLPNCTVLTKGNSPSIGLYLDG